MLQCLAFLGLGVVLARMLGDWNRWPDLLGCAVGLTTLSALFLVNLNLRLGLSLDSALLCAAAQALAAAALVLLAKPRQVQPRPAVRAVDLGDVLALASAGLVFLMTNGAQLAAVDNDYWLHAALQGHMLRGEFPPRNPFFPELPLAGHYGRDLLVVILAKALKLDLIRSQWLITSVCHAAALLLYNALLRRFTLHRWAPLVAGLCLWLGFNVGYMTGLLQLFENNSAPVYLGLGLLIALVLDLWSAPAGAKAAVLSVLAGTYALVYETHFGLLLIATTAVAVIRCCWSRERLRGSAYLALAWLGALILSCLHGGVFSDLAGRKLARPLPTLVSVQNQSQMVNLTFPKTKLLQMRIAENESQMVSLAYDEYPACKLFPLLDGPSHRADPVYTPIWSWTVLKMHWLGVLLAPFTLLLLWRRRDECGLIFLSFGISAWLVPGLVDFGPVHEAEYFRWVSAAAMGCTVALGIVLAMLLESGKRSCIALALVLTWLNTAAGWAYVGRSLGTGPGSLGVLQVLTLDTPTSHWLRRHAEPLRVRQADLDAFTYLLKEAKPGERVLVNFSPEDPWGIVFESTLANVTGLYPVGHALPLSSDRVGLPPFRMLASYAEVLRQPTSEGLRALQIDWLYLRLPADSEVAPTLEGLDLKLQVRRPDGALWLYAPRGDSGSPAVPR